MKPVKNLLEKIRNYCWVRYLFPPTINVNDVFKLEDDLKTFIKVKVLEITANKVVYRLVFHDAMLEARSKTYKRKLGIRDFSLLYKKVDS